MIQELSYFRTIAISMTLLVWFLFSAPMAYLIARDRGHSRWLFLVLGFLLGPIAALWASRLPLRKDSKVSLHRFGRFHPVAAVLATIVGLALIAASAVVGFYIRGVSGEPLQLYLVAGLIVGGLAGGFVAAVIARRVAYFESLVLAIALFCVLVVLGPKLDVAFTYGTTPVFFLVVIIAAFLILEVARVLGGSIGFMVAGDGHLSLHFGYESWVGRRYLSAKRRSSFISVITVISIGGVAVGVWAMLVVLSVMSGFMEDLKGKILGANAHLIVLRYGVDFTEYEDVMKKTLEVKGIKGVSPFVLSEGMISSEMNHSGVIIKGINPKTAPEVSDLAKNMIQGALENLDHPSKVVASSQPFGLADPADPAGSQPGQDKPEEKPGQEADDDDGFGDLDDGFDDPVESDLPGIIIGQEAARSLKVFLGDPVNFVSPVGELGPTGPVPKARVFRVVGIFYSGMYEYDAKFVYIRLDEAQELFTTNGAVTGLEVKVDDVEATTPIARMILQKIGGYPYRTKDWKEMNRNLFSALKLEKIAMFIILTFIILVASFNILSTLIMVVIEKGKEISILKSMGATDPSIMKIFVVYGLVIGALGTALGLALGFLSCLAIRQFGVGLDPEVYYIAELPVRMNPIEFAIVAVSAIVVSYLATIYPSLQAARLSPVDGLRYD